MNNQDALLEIYRQNCNHMRQQETLRMWIGNIFLAIVVAISAYLSTSTSNEKQFYEVHIIVPVVLLVISLLCLGVTLKANRVFVETKKSTINLFEDKKITLGNGQDWRKYVGGLESPSTLWKILRIRYMYVALYLIVIIAAAIWICKL